MLLAFVGDIMLGRLVNEFIHNYGYRYPMGNVVPVLKKADLIFGNLECVLSSYDKPFQKPRAFYFRADPIAVKSLKYAGFDYVSLANNHAMDFQEQGLLDTIKILDKNKIAHAGTGRNIEEARKPAILTKKGMRIAVLSFADHFEDYAATEKSGGINYIPISLKEKDFSMVRDAIKQAKAVSDLVVFSIHWGPNMRQRPTRLFREFARAVIDCGADIFHGHSAHIFQGIEIYKGKPILYDCGDFVDDYYVGEDKNDEQLIFFIIVGKDNNIEKLELVPLFISSCQVNFAEYETFERICERIKLLSKEMGTKVERKDGIFVIL